MPRSKPFSTKQKKQQLRAKRERKKAVAEAHHGACSQRSYSTSSDEDNSSVSSEPISERKFESVGKVKDKDRYRLKFQETTKEEQERRKREAMKPYTKLPSQEREVGIEDFYHVPMLFLEFPTRPPWDYKLTTAQLEQREQQAFQRWKEGRTELCDLGKHDNSYCEMNLETWRQLWRVMEMSDVLLIIVDVRFAALHFPPALFHYVQYELGKPIIIILNKCDIVPPSVAIAWKHYFLNFHLHLHVVIFTSYPKEESTREALSKGKQSHRRRKKPSAIGPLDLWNACQDIVGESVDLSLWKEKIGEDMNEEYSDESDTEVTEGVERKVPDLGFIKHEKYKDGILTIGCLGYPNVGKSSVINGLKGKKVVSISKTPGHTKHFQTIFLTKNVKLCDCPGLVFPSTAPRPIQVLAGMFPVAQLKEPYSTVQYLAERCDIISMLGLQLPEDEQHWSAYLICDALAKKKGFMTARGARTDPYRGANFILRAALEGKLLMYLLPHDYHNKEDHWKACKESKEFAALQADRVDNAENDNFSAEQKFSQQQQNKRMRKQRTKEEQANLGESETSETDSDEDGSDEEENTVSSKNPFALLSND